MFPLCLWTEPINSSVWGDKDLFWSSLSCAADENYEFNEYSAASVGERTTDEKGNIIQIVKAMNFVQLILVISMKKGNYYG